MRENRPYGSEGGESGSTGLPYPYRRPVATCRQTVEAFLAPLPPLGSGWLRRAERLYSVDHPFIFTINENGNVCFLFEFGYFCLRTDVRQC